jgi:recombinational DNA repair ATPase RecF
MRYFLTGIKVEGFRGINNESDPLNLRFHANKVNSVFAENAVGKSSLFEALCYAIRGLVPKLRELQAQEEPDSYITNRFHSRGVATIDLQFQGDDGSAPIDIKVMRDATGTRTVTSPSGYSAPDGLLHSLNEDFALLDYRTFQEFIDSTPLKRGRSFAALLGLSRYSHFTQALRAVADKRTLNADLGLGGLRTAVSEGQTAAQNALRRIAASYEKLTGKQLTAVADLDQYVQDVTDALAGIALIKEDVQAKNLTDIDFDKVSERIRSEELGDKRNNLQTLIKTISTLKGLGESDLSSIATDRQSLRDLIAERDELLARTKGAAFKALYDTADALLKSGEWPHEKQCPLCESSLQFPIGQSIIDKRHQYDRVVEQETAIREAWVRSSVAKRLSSLESAADLNIPPQDKRSSVLATQVDQNRLQASDVDNAVTCLEVLEEQLATAIRDAETRKAEIEKDLPPSLVSLSEQIQAAIQFRDALEEYRQGVMRKQANELKLAIRERWQEFVSNAFRVFAEAEADLAQRKIAEIDTDYKGVFAKIMNVKDVVPELHRPADRQDLHVHLKEFHGLSDLSARALLSESFRNALAVSVFLSAALKHTGAPRFVVLDDVTSSFDSGHQWLLMEAIRLSFQQPQNPNGLQFIIFSHDGLLAKYFDKLGNTQDWHHQKLQGMPPIGAVISQAQDADRLRSTAQRLLSAGQIAQAQPLLRQYLEFKLLQVINKVAIPVPLDFAIKDHQKMVSNCLDAIGKAIDLHGRAGDLIVDAGQQRDIDTMHVPALLANWVSHYETASGASVSAPVLASVISTVDAFAECFRYDDTDGGSTVRRWYRSLSSR